MEARKLVRNFLAVLKKNPYYYLPKVMKSITSVSFNRKRDIMSLFSMFIVNKPIHPRISIFCISSSIQAMEMLSGLAHLEFPTKLVSDTWYTCTLSNATGPTLKCVWIQFFFGFTTQKIIYLLRRLSVHKWIIMGRNHGVS